MNKSAPNCCAVCGQPIDICPYGGDCGEMKIIYREQQREKLRDIEIRDGECAMCGEELLPEDFFYCAACEMEFHYLGADDAAE